MILHLNNAPVFLRRVPGLPPTAEEGVELVLEEGAGEEVKEAVHARVHHDTDLGHAERNVDGVPNLNTESWIQISIGAS